MRPEGLYQWNISSDTTGNRTRYLNLNQLRLKRARETIYIQKLVKFVGDEIV
jgi:hypothetical protein